MHRHFFGFLLATLAVGLLTASSASAGDQALQEQVKQLQEKVEALSANQQKLLSAEVEKYLGENAAVSAQGGASDWVKNLKIDAALTMVGQATLGQEFNSHAIDGSFDLNFDFKVTDNLDLFAHLTANTGGSGFPSNLVTAPTAGGFLDGIDLDGTQPVTPGSVTVYEAGLTHRIAMGDNWFYWSIGKLDPREHFGQNAMTEDAHTQFLNNNFDDSPSFQWYSTLAGTPFGLLLWAEFGDQKQFVISAGMFNFAGSFFSQPQTYAQFAWTGDVNEHPMGIKVYICYDDGNKDTGGDATFCYGVSWDWWINDKIGVFAKLAGSTDAINPVEFDVELGVVFHNLISSRPDDTIGVGLAFLFLDDTFAPFAEDMEWTLEVYYKFVVEDGHLSITPHVMYVQDPNGGLGWLDDNLFVIGLRLNAQF